MINGFNDTRDFVYEGDGASDVIEDGDFADLLPRVGDVFKEFHDSVGHVLECTKVDAFVVAEFPVTHISVVFDNFPDVLGRQVLHDVSATRATSDKTGHTCLPIST